MTTMPVSKSKQKHPSSAVPQEEATPPKARPTKVVYELDKSRGNVWTAYQHILVDGVLESTVVISEDLPQITKRKLEFLMFVG